jgi:sporulation protein YlmC with PRC-barrel domain
MDLVHDLLDKKVVDRNGREMGRVDGIVLDVHGNSAPHVVAFLLGPAVLAHRLHPIFGRWMAGLEHALGIDRGRPLHIPFDKVLDVHDHVKVDLAFGETAAATVEQGLRRWVSAIPRSS